MKKKFVYYVTLSIFILTSLIFGIYFINNHNKFIIYEFVANDGSFGLEGNATFSRKRNILNINKIRYMVDDKPVYGVKISLLFIDSKNNEQLLYSTKKDSDELFSLKESISSYSITLSEFYGYEEYFRSKIIHDFSKSMYLKITYKDQNMQEINHLLKLDSIKYANDKFIYRKTPKIY